MLSQLFTTGYASFWSDMFSTVTGGIVLAVIFFFAKEKFFPLPKLVGRWFFEIKTEKTSYNPYLNMILRYEAIIWCEGNKIFGTAEKIYENSSTGKRKFIGKNRTRGNVTGYIQKNYFGKDEIYIHIIEDGHGRKYTNFYNLKSDRDCYVGKFVSMVAEQEGISKWQRERY